MAQEPGRVRWLSGLCPLLSCSGESLCGAAPAAVFGPGTKYGLGYRAGLALVGRPSAGSRLGHTLVIRQVKPALRWFEGFF